MTAYFFAGMDTELLGEDISITVTETGGGGASALVELSGRFFHIHELDAAYAGVAWLALQNELAAALNGAGLNAAYSVSFGPTTGFFTITAFGGGVTAIQIAFTNATTRRILGFSGPVSASLSHTSTIRSYYFISGTEACVTEWSELREVDDDIQTDLIAWDGSWVEGLARPGAIKDWVLEVPWEPRAAIWADEAVSTVPFTWEAWFPHLRTGVPFIVMVAGLFPANRESMACVPSAKRTAFRPKLLGGDYLGHASIPLSGYYIGIGAVP